MDLPSVLQNPGVNNSTIANSGNYSVVITNANNCSVTLNTNVVVNPTPTITLTNTGPYCLGNTIQLNASGGSSYSWSGPMAYSANVQNPGKHHQCSCYTCRELYGCSN